MVQREDQDNQPQANTTSDCNTFSEGNQGKELRWVGVWDSRVSNQVTFEPSQEGVEEEGHVLVWGQSQGPEAGTGLEHCEASPGNTVAPAERARGEWEEMCPEAAGPTGLRGRKEPGGRDGEPLEGYAQGSVRGARVGREEP